MPHIEDILRARLKTIGVSEHRFTLKAGLWTTYAVNHQPASPNSREYAEPWLACLRRGRRTFLGKLSFLRCSIISPLTDDLAFWHRCSVVSENSDIYLIFCSSIVILSAAWAPYFDNMDAIIFLSPISCFDQVCVEFVYSISAILILLPPIPGAWRRPKRQSTGAVFFCFWQPRRRWKSCQTSGGFDIAMEIHCVKSIAEEYGDSSLLEQNRYHARYVIPTFIQLFSLIFFI